ncbi:MAG TPA: YbhB/YbcL family Raf kinase inhibitor-like protein, partial [Mycobacterium sp.]
MAVAPNCAFRESNAPQPRNERSNVFDKQTNEPEKCDLHDGGESVFGGSSMRPRIAPDDRRAKQGIPFILPRQSGEAIRLSTNVDRSISENLGDQMKRVSWLVVAALVVNGVLTGACSSSSDKTGTGGSAGGSAGKTGTAGKTGAAGTIGTGGTAGTAGGAGGDAGGTGTGGTAGAAGVGGAGGVGCTGGSPPVTPHHSCMDIPKVGAAGAGGAGGAGGAAGAVGFSISSPDFTYCGAIPANMTCDGHDFGTGTNPKLTWSGAPAGTMSYAIVFKDISLLADTNSSTAETDINIQHGYHWAMWDIPATTTQLSTGSATGYHSTDISGALQYSQRNNYGYFPPCPNPFPKSDPRFGSSCSLTLDSYSYTLYAFSFAPLPSLPTPDLNANGDPTGNYAAKMGRYIDSLTALAVTEYRGTSSAWASAFA